MPQLYAAYPGPLDLFILAHPGMPEMWHNLNRGQAPNNKLALEEQIKVYLLSTISKAQFSLQKVQWYLLYGYFCPTWGMK